MVKAFIVATPSGRSIISRRDDPNKALHKTKSSAKSRLKQVKSRFNVKLKVKQITVSKANRKFI